MKKILFFISTIVISGIFSGCSFSGKPDGGVYKTEDGGKNFQQKNWISEDANLNQSNVLSMAMSQNDPQIIYIGTKSSGLFRTVSGGDQWERDVSRFTNVTSVVLGPYDPNVIFISTIVDNRGKIFKTVDGGGNWEEIYTEKSDGSYVLSLAIDKSNPEIVYASNSLGGIFKSEDSGNSWTTLLWAESSVKNIVFDNINPNIIYFGTSSKGVMISKNQGTNFEEIIPSGNIYALVADPVQEGKIFVSDNDGLHVSEDFGENWSTINTLVKPENLYSRGLAINPNDSKEIFYSSGEALYKSTNGGDSWTPIQFNFNRIIGNIVINFRDSAIIYLGTRKISDNSFQLFPTF